MHHLTLDQRCHIEELVSSGLSLRKIAELVGVHASTICRELKKNTGRRYNYMLADKISADRRHQASSRFKKIKGDLEKKIVEGLCQLWSPDQISGRLKLEGIRISHEAIYQYARKNNLRCNLRHRGKKYKVKKETQAGIKHIPNRVDISTRPDIVNQKARIGDWEGDTVISHNSRHALLTLVDRHSKYTIIRKIGQKKAEHVTEAAIKALKKLKLPVHTITFDNGAEFARHEKLTEKLKAAIYFARPYKSCDRGLNEHTNGLIRQFLPKKFDFKDVPDHNIQIIEDFLNHRPRKVLNYLAPVEVISLYNHCCNSFLNGRNYSI